MNSQLDFLATLEGLAATPPLPPIPEPTPASPPELTETARELLRGIGCERLAEQVRVEWNNRLRTTAGQAFYANCLVVMNPRLLQFGTDEIDKTLRHELAHLAARSRAGRRRIEPHGPEWRQACTDLGLPDEDRCHNLPLPRTRQRIRHLYRCPQCRRLYPRVRPFRRRVACLDCCRIHARGRYDDRFRLAKIPI